MVLQGRTASPLNPNVNHQVVLIKIKKQTLDNSIEINIKEENKKIKH